MTESSNGYYPTTEFKEAVYLKSKGVIFIKTVWRTPNQATFLFKQPSDDVLSAWGRGDDGGVRAILDAADFFRGEINRRDR